MELNLNIKSKEEINILHSFQVCVLINFLSKVIIFIILTVMLVLPKHVELDVIDPSLFGLLTPGEKMCY